jgi:hypothetical protein
MVLHGAVEGECGDRDEGDQVEDAATSEVFLVELIGIPFVGAFVAGARTVMAMSVSFS